eukprot:7477667-Heterocapsa_arctica.AAC.1
MPPRAGRPRRAPWTCPGRGRWPSHRASQPPPLLPRPSAASWGRPPPRAAACEQPSRSTGDRSPSAGHSRPQPRSRR